MAGISAAIAVRESRLARDQDAVNRDEWFESLVNRQARFVFRVAYSVVRNAPVAEDVVQETFLKLYRSRAGERIRDERAFLARTAWRIGVNHLKRSRGAATESQTPSAGDSPEQAALASDWNAAVRRLIDALPDELRQPLTLSALDEMNSRQISKVMGIREGTVRTRLSRARQVLKQKLMALGACCHEHSRPR